MAPAYAGSLLEKTIGSLLGRLGLGARLCRIPLAPVPEYIAGCRRKDGAEIYAACEGEPESQDNEDIGSDPTVGANPGER